MWSLRFSFIITNVRICTLDYHEHRYSCAADLRVLSWTLPDYAHPRQCRVCGKQQIRKVNDDVEVLKWCSSSSRTTMIVCVCAELASRNAALVAKCAAAFARSEVDALERSRQAAQDAARVSLAATREIRILLISFHVSVAVHVATRASVFAKETYESLSELIATTVAAKRRKRKKIKLKKKRLVVLPSNTKTLASSSRRKRVGGGFSVVQIRDKSDVRLGKKKKLKVKLKRRKKLRWKRKVQPAANNPTLLHVGRDVESKSNLLPSGGLLTKSTIRKKKKKKIKPKTKKVALRRISVLRGSKKPMSSVK